MAINFDRYSILNRVKSLAPSGKFRSLLAFILLLSVIFCFRFDLFDVANRKANLSMLARRIDSNAEKIRHTPNKWCKGDFRIAHGKIEYPECLQYPDSTDLEQWKRTENTFFISPGERLLQINFEEGDSLVLASGSICGKNKIEYILARIDSQNYAYIKTHTQGAYGFWYDTSYLTKENFFKLKFGEQWKYNKLEYTPASNRFYSMMASILRSTMLVLDSNESCSDTW